MFLFLFLFLMELLLYVSTIIIIICAVSDRGVRWRGVFLHTLWRVLGAIFDVKFAWKPLYMLQASKFPLRFESVGTELPNPG